MKTRRWDREATVGLITLVCVAVLAALLLSVFLKKSPAPLSPVETGSDTVPSEATDVTLPADKLTDAQEIVSPLLRAKVAAFDSAESADDKQILTALLLHAAFDEGEGEQSDGIASFDAAEIDASFARLLGRKLVRPAFAEDDGIVFEDGQYRVDLMGSDYAAAAIVTAVSAQTLGDTVYVHFTVTEPVYPEEPEVPEEPEEPEESEVSEEPEETEEPEEPVEPAWEITRNAVVGLRYEEHYTVLFLRDEE